MTKPYNTTQLDPGVAMERHIYHRDQFAHYLRWSHVLKRADIGMKILDVGCGTGNLFEVLYRNRFKPARYLGLEYRKHVVDKNKEKWAEHGAEFLEVDVTKPFDFRNDWDMITSFEVAEHIGKQNVPAYLQNIKGCMNEKTIFLVSTPCFDEKVGAADNHTYDSGDGRGHAVHEMTYHEFADFLINAGFDIKNHWGTFASIKDYKPELTGELKVIYDRLHEYYDSNVLSVLMAPLFPKRSRNVLWECTL